MTLKNGFIENAEGGFTTEKSRLTAENRRKGSS